MTELSSGKLIVAGVVFLPTTSAVFWTVIAFLNRDDPFAAILFAVTSGALAVALGLFTSGVLILRRKRG
jgi:hypothetical protein